MRLDSIRAIVTGAARGMGAHFCRRLAEAGAQVVAADVDEGGLQALVAECDGAPGRVVARTADVADEAAIGALVDAAWDELGRVNCLVNNAGIIRDGLLVRRDRHSGAIQKMTAADWNAVIGVNLSGATFLVRDVAAKMAEQGEQPGVIVNMSSVARHGNRGQSNYVAAKAALAANTVTWARELARFGIRVGAIAPGMIETPMTRGMNQKARDALVAAVPAGRIGEPEDVWLALKFVLECDYFTGRCLDVDGGLVM